MSKYVHIAILGFKSKYIYRSNLLFGYLMSIIKIYVTISLWSALYNFGTKTNTTLNEAITYSVLVIFIYSKAFISISKDISELIYNGEIELELIKPSPFIVRLTLKKIGENLYNLLFFTIPIIIALQMLYNFFVFNFEQLNYIIISFFLGQMIYLLIQAILGYSSFWLKANWYIVWIEGSLMGLFGGMLVPLWFYPEWMFNIANFLPFKYIIFDVTNIILGKCSNEEAFKIIVIQLLWVIMLFIIESFLWRVGRKKIEINGG